MPKQYTRKGLAVNAETFEREVLKPLDKFSANSPQQWDESIWDSVTFLRSVIKIVKKSKVMNKSCELVIKHAINVEQLPQKGVRHSFGKVTLKLKLPSSKEVKLCEHDVEYYNAYGQYTLRSWPGIYDSETNDLKSKLKGIVAVL